RTNNLGARELFSSWGARRCRRGPLSVTVTEMPSTMLPAGLRCEGVPAGAQLDAQWSSLERQALAKPSLKIALVALADLVQRAAVDHDDRRVLAALVRVAHLGADRPVARRRLVLDGGDQVAGELGR